jgi:hypothetical protein
LHGPCLGPAAYDNLLDASLKFRKLGEDGTGRATTAILEHYNVLGLEKLLPLQISSTARIASDVQAQIVREEIPKIPPRDSGEVGAIDFVGAEVFLPRREVLAVNVDWDFVVEHAVISFSDAGFVAVFLIVFKGLLVGNIFECICVELTDNVKSLVSLEAVRAPRFL